jgi:uncharacterized protein YdhG (YjbR/CyaY superfamily)
MSPNIDTPSNVDEYILRFPKEVQQKLELLRTTIKKAAPKATETISYKMPAYKQNGILVYFAAYKNHIGFYPTSAPMIFFSKELAGFKTSKGAVQFPVEEPLPLKLITAMVKFRVSADVEKVKTKKVKSV